MGQGSQLSPARQETRKLYIIQSIISVRVKKNMKTSYKQMLKIR